MNHSAPDTPDIVNPSHRRAGGRPRSRVRRMVLLLLFFLGTIVATGCEEATAELPTRMEVFIASVVDDLVDIPGAEIKFTHKIEETGCPQEVGRITLTNNSHRKLQENRELKLEDHKDFRKYMEKDEGEDEKLLKEASDLPLSFSVSLPDGPNGQPALAFRRVGADSTLRRREAGVLQPGQSVEFSVVFTCEGDWKPGHKLEADIQVSSENSNGAAEMKVPVEGELK